MPKLVVICGDLISIEMSSLGGSTYEIPQNSFGPQTHASKHYGITFSYTIVPQLFLIAAAHYFALISPVKSTFTAAWGIAAVEMLKQIGSNDDSIREAKDDSRHESQHALIANLLFLSSILGSLMETMPCSHVHWSKHRAERIQQKSS